MCGVILVVPQSFALPVANDTNFLYRPVSAGLRFAIPPVC